MGYLVSAVIMCMLGFSTVAVSAQFCDCAGTYTTSVWLVQCYGMNSSTMYEITNVLRYIKLTYPYKDLIIDVSLSVGEDFPDDIFIGYKVVALVMTKCNFTDLPYELLSNMPRDMVALDFSDNFISTIDGQRLNQLPFAKGLVNLNLQNNQLQSLPEDSFLNFGSLESLSLQGNLLEELVNNTFQGLTSLKSLYLHQNSLTNLETNAFVSLVSLRMVSMELNQITFLNNGTFSTEEQPRLIELPLEGKV